jgi:hypothetical protein
MKTRFYLSGSVYSGPHPENVLDPVDVMLSYWEISRKIAKQHERFKKIRNIRKRNAGKNSKGRSVQTEK